MQALLSMVSECIDYVARGLSWKSSEQTKVFSADKGFSVDKSGCLALMGFSDTKDKIWVVALN